MLKSLNILFNSFKLTLQELKVNKLRTILSLTGVAFGIFCIIGVLTTVGSLEQNIQNEINSLGSNTIYIDKWQYGGENRIPFWKLRSRPTMKYDEMKFVHERASLLSNVVYLQQTQGNITAGDYYISGSVYGITEDQINIQPFKFDAGRYFSSSEFHSGSAVAIIGHEIANQLFGNADRAIGKEVDAMRRRATVIGVMEKQGQGNMGWNYDNAILLPYNFTKNFISEDNSNPIIIAKGKPGVETDQVVQELRGIMRQVRRLSPTTEDNFSLNSVEALGKQISGFFVMINLVGSIIGGISLIVGMFGIANIMFVTVKERTPIIGLKKAIGAKRSSILFEFLMEAALLCIMGGIIGILLVYIMTRILSGPLDFPVFISGKMFFFTFLICLVVGIIAGIIPAAQASKLDPVKAIRS